MNRRAFLRSGLIALAATTGLASIVKLPRRPEYYYTASDVKIAVEKHLGKLVDWDWYIQKSAENYSNMVDQTIINSLDTLKTIG